MRIAIELNGVLRDTLKKIQQEYEKWYLEGRLGAVPNIARETFRNELIDYIKS